MKVANRQIHPNLRRRDIALTDYKTDYKSENNPENKDQPKLKLSQNPAYRDSYANSVQVRMSVWDFFLIFGTMHQEGPAEVAIENFQGIYLSPQQAKALWNVLGHNLAQYEQTFGTLALEPKFVPPVPPGGPVN